MAFLELGGEEHVEGAEPGLPEELLVTVLPGIISSE